MWCHCFCCLCWTAVAASAVTSVVVAAVRAALEPWPSSASPCIRFRKHCYGSSGSNGNSSRYVAVNGHHCNCNQPPSISSGTQRHWREGKTDIIDTIHLNGFWCVCACVRVRARAGAGAGARAPFTTTRTDNDCGLNQRRINIVRASAAMVGRITNAIPLLFGQFVSAYSSLEDGSIHCVVQRYATKLQG